MNSKLRSTFGLFDKEGKKYQDIISAFLRTCLITAQDYDEGKIVENMTFYYLHCDKELRKELGTYGHAKVLISFQHRTNGLYAIARLFKDSQDVKNKE